MCVVRVAELTQYKSHCRRLNRTEQQEIGRCELLRVLNLYVEHLVSTAAEVSEYATSRDQRDFDHLEFV